MHNFLYVLDEKRLISVKLRGLASRYEPCVYVLPVA